MFRRPRRKIPLLNTTSTADISFMLLVFFLVTSSMDTDKGLPRQLPPPQNEMETKELLVKERNMMQVELDDRDQLTIDGQAATLGELTRRTIEFVANVKDDATMPEKSVREVNFFGRCAVSDRHVIAIQVSRQTSYEAYFHLQNAIVTGYTQLRNQLARKHFHRPYTRCSAAERDAINMVYPQRISEDKPKTVEQEGGDA